MKKIKKFAAYTAVVIVFVIIAGASYVTFALPDVGKPEDIKVDLTPERIARGKYLANHVTVCVDCHSGRDWSKFAGPIDSNIIGAGGEKFDEGVGFPGHVYVPNITPASLKTWTDGELYRAITAGVKKDGSAIFPIMPYTSYGKMDKQDIYDIIAYVRSLKPIAKTYPKRELNFPLNMLVNTMPQKAGPVNKPSTADTLKYGRYLVQAAACADCHTKAVKGKQVAGMEFAGDNEYKLAAGGVLHSSNITPDKETGIGSWSKQQFLDRFKQYANGTAKAYPVKAGEFNSIMPWWKYGGMRTSDLEAMYAYLKTIKPVKNKVVKFSTGNVAAIN